jgi:hypothetical protein
MAVKSVEDEWESGSGGGKVLEIERDESGCAVTSRLIGRPTATVIEIATCTHLGSPRRLQLTNLTQYCQRPLKPICTVLQCEATRFVLYRTLEDMHLMGLLGKPC